MLGGGFMGDVIDFKARQSGSTQKSKKSENSGVIDIAQKRMQILEDDRRRVKRTLLTEFIAVHAVVPGAGLQKVILYDINEHGLSFDLGFKFGQFVANEQLAMRVYLNHQTYFTFTVNIKRVNEIKDEQVYRHGGEFVKGTLNDVALHHFVKFMETVSASLRNDKGDVIVSNINS